MDWNRVVELIPDVVQIFILYLAIYAILKGARGSRFGQVLMGIGILFALLIAFTLIFNFDVLSVIVRWLLLYLALSSVVIFQAEIRRILATMGALLFQDRSRVEEHGRLTPETFTSIIFKLAKTHTGALIAFERSISLRGYETTGVPLDALVSPELMFSIFTEPLPLHDGGVVIRHGRIAAAHCLFPVSSQSDLSASGMRHRAAVGLSEEADALIVVVSEETGRVSIAHNGRLIRYPDAGESSRNAVLRWIRKAMPVQKTTAETVADWIKKRADKFTPGNHGRGEDPHKPAPSSSSEEPPQPNEEGEAK